MGKPDAGDDHSLCFSEEGSCGQLVGQHGQRDTTHSVVRICMRWVTEWMSYDAPCDSGSAPVRTERRSLVWPQAPDPWALSAYHDDTFSRHATTGSGSPAGSTCRGPSCPARPASWARSELSMGPLASPVRLKGCSASLAASSPHPGRCPAYTAVGSHRASRRLPRSSAQERRRRSRRLRRRRRRLRVDRVRCRHRVWYWSVHGLSGRRTAVGDGHAGLLRARCWRCRRRASGRRRGSPRCGRYVVRRRRRRRVRAVVSGHGHTRHRHGRRRTWRGDQSRNVCRAAGRCRLRRGRSRRWCRRRRLALRGDKNCRACRSHDQAAYSCGSGIVPHHIFSRI